MLRLALVINIDDAITILHIRGVIRYNAGTAVFRLSCRHDIIHVVLPLLAFQPWAHPGSKADIRLNAAICPVWHPCAYQPGVVHNFLVSSLNVHASRGGNAPPAIEGFQLLLKACAVKGMGGRVPILFIKVFPKCIILFLTLAFPDVAIQAVVGIWIHVFSVFLQDFFGSVAVLVGHAGIDHADSSLSAKIRLCLLRSPAVPTLGHSPCIYRLISLFEFCLNHVGAGIVHADEIYLGGNGGLVLVGAIAFQLPVLGLHAHLAVALHILRQVLFRQLVANPAVILRCHIISNILDALADAVCHALRVLALARGDNAVTAVQALIHALGYFGTGCHNIRSIALILPFLNDTCNLAQGVCQCAKLLAASTKGAGRKGSIHPGIDGVWLYCRCIG